MITHVVAVRDLKADVWGQPYFVNSIGGAVRSFMDMCKKPTDDQGQSNVFHAHPEDFELWYIGTYDDSDAALGSFSPTDRKRLFSGSDL